ncbi:heparinase II/III family protein [Devosia sp. CN2-171]|uniref:heparinase II/III family protein n=1 Tax=Devosia sp. CN2-171 TaxID=3400909 RepID=UPI003BF8A9CD
MKLGWYINRLRSMEPAEVAHRFVEAAKKRASRGRHEGWERYPAPLRIVPIPGVRERIRGAGPDHRAAIGAAAADILAGRFGALGRQWPDRSPDNLFPPELWRLDPVTGGLWPGPNAYAFDIDFRHDGSLGDIKYVWEINRLQFLVALAAEAMLTERREPIVAIEAAIASWHAANPPFRGVGWASGIEVALRAISLILVAGIAGPQVSRQCTRQIGEILAASAFWLPRYPSKYSSANNHLVAELTGEYLLAHTLDHSTRHAGAKLVAETFRQILPDGTPAEQTPTYGAFTAEMILLAASIGGTTGHPFPRAPLDRLGAFADFVVALGQPTPGYGDDDEGRVLTLGPEPDYAASVASAIAVLLGRPGPAPRPGDLRALIFGAPPLVASRRKGLTTFPDGGLSVWHGRTNGRDARLVLDHGPLGYLSIAAHGHADALSLTLSLDGEPVLVDPGTYLYGSGGAWRSWFRSTPAHNTLNLEGQSQSTMSGAFNWSHKAIARLDESGNEPNTWLRMSHDGYLKRFGRRHQRTIEIHPGRIAVTDQLLGGPPLDAEIVFQLAPGLVAEADGSSVLVRRNEDRLLRLDFPSSHIAIAIGEDRPDGGWGSPRFGQKLPAARLSWRGPVGEGAVTTWLTPLAPSALDTHPTQT